MVNVKDNISYIREILYVLAKRLDRDVDDIKLVCVTKEASLEQLNEALSAGITDFGENRIQDARNKMTGIDREVRWHMIGHLQKNKIREAIGMFDLIQSLDNAETADAMELEAQKQNRTVDVLVEVNTSGEASKFGTTIKELPGLILHTAALRHLNIMGLMTIAPFTDDPQASRPYFKSLRELSERIKEICPDNVNPVRPRLENSFLTGRAVCADGGIESPSALKKSAAFSNPERIDHPHTFKDGSNGVKKYILSMGMSSDFEVAIEEGSNMIRIGSLIFKSDTERVKERLTRILQ